MRILRRSMPGLCLAALTLAVAAPPPALAQTSNTPLAHAQTFAQLDGDMLKVVQVYDTIRGTFLTQLTPQDARQQFAPEDAAKAIARASGAAEAPTPVGKVVDGMTVPGEDGTLIPIRIYYPSGAGPFPVIVYYHGGGFVVATIDTYDESGRTLCDDANAIVVSVEYRKAPEAAFPAALHDAIDSYRWVTNNIGAYNGIASRVAVAGESAGGNLAAEVTLAARDDGFQMPTEELLIYPETTSNLDQQSDLLYTDPELPLYRAELYYFDGFYLPNNAEANNPEVAPIDANLKGLPPTTIIAAQIDPLRSDGQDYATALHKAGDVVTYQLYTGVTHEFFGMGAVVAKAKQAELFGGAQLAASFK